MSEYVYGTDDREGHWFTGERIIRCRDCKFGAYDGNECMRIDEWDESLWFPVEPEGYCKWGAPRDAPDPTCDECGMKCIEKYEAGCPREERQEWTTRRPRRSTSWRASR